MEAKRNKNDNEKCEEMKNTPEFQLYAAIVSPLNAETNDTTAQRNRNESNAKAKQKREPKGNGCRRCDALTEHTLE